MTLHQSCDRVRDRMGSWGIERMSVITGTILLERPTAPDPSKIAAEVGATLKLTPLASTDGQILTGPCGPVTAETVHRPSPLATGLAKAAWWWPEAGRAASAHAAHLTISCPWTGLGAVEAHVRHTVLVMSVLGQVPALAVVWGGVLVSPAHFRAMFEEMVEHRRLPVPLWVRVDLARDPAGQSAASTDGLSRFGLMEIEIERSPLEPGELYEYTRRLAEYLITSGPVVGDGDAVGNSEADRALVRHAPSVRPGRGTVYQLSFDRV